MEWDGINRRRFVRYQFPYTIHIYSKQGRPISTYTEDISEVGVRVITRQKLEVGTVLKVKIYVRPDFILCTGKIIWVKEKDSPVLNGIDFYSSGIELSGVDEHSRALLDKCIKELKKSNKGG